MFIWAPNSGNVEEMNPTYTGLGGANSFVSQCSPTTHCPIAAWVVVETSWPVLSVIVRNDPELWRGLVKRSLRRAEAFSSVVC